MLLRGQGVDEPDAVRAAHWTREAAGQGLQAAQKRFGRMLEVGQGVERDEVAAYVWFHLAGSTADLARVEGNLAPQQLEAALRILESEPVEGAR